MRWEEERDPGRAPVAGDVRGVAGKENRGLGFLIAGLSQRAGRV